MSDLTNSRPTLLRTVLEPGNYTAITDRALIVGGTDCTLAYTTFTPATNATCATAAPLTVGTSLSGTRAR